MNLTTAALLLSLHLGATPSSSDNFDFSAGKTTHWDGQGFHVVGLGKSGTAPYGVSSSKHTGSGNAVLHRTFTIPRNAVYIQFQAARYRPEKLQPTGMLNIVLEAAAREVLPRDVRMVSSWQPSKEVLGLDGRRLREYRWSVEAHAGKRVRIAIVDTDPRPGCYVFCSGFRFLTRTEILTSKFGKDISELQRKKGLPRMSRFESKHYTAYSATSNSDSKTRLEWCETLYDSFFSHFRKRGIPLRVPSEKLMVVIFSTKDAFDAFLGQKLDAVTGVYLRESNRLAVYDITTHQGLKDGTKQGEAIIKAANNDLERHRRRIGIKGVLRDFRDETTISTVIHEAAHQLSFNTGLLNRTGDVPLSIVEGLAMYCEPTIKDSWQGIGEPNPMRAKTLADHQAKKGKLMRVVDLIRNDDWRIKAYKNEDVLLGYSQSWVLFRLLMEERPRQLRSYLQSIYHRRTPDHRLTDFIEAFGDLAKLEKRYFERINEIIRSEVPKNSSR